MGEYDDGEPLNEFQKQVAEAMFMYAYGKLPIPYPYSTDEHGAPRLKFGIFIRPDSIHPDHNRIMEERAAAEMALPNTHPVPDTVSAAPNDPGARYVSNELCAKLLQQWVFDVLRPLSDIPSFDAATLREGVYDSYLLRHALANDFMVSLEHIKPTAIAGAVFHYYWFWVALRRKRFTPLIEIRTPHRRAEYLQQLLALAATREDWCERVLT